MSEDKVLSMSLDEIIRLKRTGGSTGAQNSSYRKQLTGTRGSSNRVKTGKIRPSLLRVQNRNNGPRLQISYGNSRGILRQRGLYASQRGRSTRNWNLVDRNRQRQYNIALGRSRLQVAKRFLNQRQRGSMRGRMLSAGAMQQRQTWRGRGQRIIRGRGGLQYSGLTPNTFRSDQILKLSRMNTYQNKVNRSLSAARRNQQPTGPSLIVSIDNERAGPSSAPSIRGMRRGRGGEVGGGWNRQHANMFNRAPLQEYQQALPYHTGALDPEIQMVIADIQGKRKPNNFSSRGSMSRGGSDGVRGRGIGRVQRFGRTQLARRQDVNYARMNLGLPLGITINTLNERFGGRR